MYAQKGRAQLRQEKKWTLWRVLAWPFVALWAFVTTILKLVGRVMLFVIGLVLMIVGALLTATVIGLVIGIPLALVGLLLTLRSLF
jgi:hypothetical protein